MKYSKLEKKFIRSIVSYEMKNYDASFQEVFKEIFQKFFSDCGMGVKDQRIKLYLVKESNDKLLSYKFKLIALIILLRSLEERKMIFFIKKNEKKEFLYNPVYKKKTTLYEVDLGYENLENLIRYLHADIYTSQNLVDEVRFKMLTKENISLIISIFALVISLCGGVIDFFDLGKPKSIIIRN